MNSPEKRISDLTRVCRFYWRNELSVNCLLLNTTHCLFPPHTKSDRKNKITIYKDIKIHLPQT